MECFVVAADTSAEVWKQLCVSWCHEDAVLFVENIDH